VRYADEGPADRLDMLMDALRDEWAADYSDPDPECPHCEGTGLEVIDCTHGPCLTSPCPHDDVTGPCRCTVTT